MCTGDVLFGLLKQLRSRRSSLKVLVMSATLDAESFSKFWDSAPVGYVAGRQFPVTTYYSVEPQIDYVDAAITTVLQIHMDEAKFQGDILVFLTGLILASSCVCVCECVCVCVCI